MTKQQIKWASQHDWYVRAYDDGSIEVCETCSLTDDTHYTQWEIRQIIHDWQELRDWAGY